VAFAELHDAYRPKILAYLAHWTDRDTAEDIAQEAFIDSWRVLPHYRFDVPLYFWLKRAAHFKALHVWRYSNYRRNNISLDDEDEETAAFCRTIADRNVGDFEEMLAQSQAFDYLSAEQRTVLDLIFAQGVTRSDAARRLKCSVGTIEARLENALRKLRAYFTGVEIGLLAEQGSHLRKRSDLRAQYEALDRSRLRGRYREAFDLVYGRGLDYDEAARELNASVPMVRMWANGAVARLRVHGEIAAA
jgi:RNA polymerase sigma-70 factor, ECF subfamily